MYSDGTVWGARVRRAFEYFGDFEIHYRHCEPVDGQTVLCLHPSPVSALGIAPIVSELGRHFHVLAPDTLGNGDSAGPMPEVPDIAFYADVCTGFLKARGVTSCAIYGCHTGASIAMEIARRGDIAVRSLILDGVGIYPPDFRQKLLDNYIPDLTPDRDGLYALKLWMMLRDMYLFWPWFEKDAANRRPVDLPSSQSMHARFVETLKAVTTFGKSYQAAFRYDKLATLSRLEMPVMITSAEGDMLSGADQQVLAALPNGIHRANAGFADADAARRTGELFAGFLRRPEPN